MPSETLWNCVQSILLKQDTIKEALQAINSIVQRGVTGVKWNIISLMDNILTLTHVLIMCFLTLVNTGLFNSTSLFFMLLSKTC